MISLNDFKAICKTDKYNDWSSNGPGPGHNYVGSFYDSICQPIRESATAVLEVGVLAGHSHLLWSCFFPNARIYGCDIVAPPYPNHNKITLYGLTDAYRQDMVDLFAGHEPSGYDLIVDDGPHTLETQRFFLEHYFKLVKPQGYLVIEDVINELALNQLMTTAIQMGETNYYFSPASTPGNLIHAIVVKKTQ